MKTTAITIAITAALLLSACQSSEEKAEKYYQSGLALMQQGDDDRALVEFRNVFKLNGFHKESRRAYAEILLKRGTYSEAVGQYLRVVEQDPNDGPARRTLAEIFAMTGNWVEAERHGKEAIRLLPDDPTVAALKIMLDYRKALADDNTDAMADAIKTANAYLAAPPAQVPQKGLPGGAYMIRQMLIADALKSNDTVTALKLVDDSLKTHPDDLQLNTARLLALHTSGDVAGVGQQLRDMVDRFPDNTEIQRNMISWYMSQKDFAGAEAFLRRRAGDQTSEPDGHVALIQMLRTTKGIEAARAEAEALLAANTGTPNADLYGAILAGFDFEQGQKSEAIQKIEAILAKAAPSEQTGKIRIMQAKMLASEGDMVGARAQIETVLKDDASNVDALKVRAAWAISDDKPGEAIIDLRKALDFAPRDPDIMTLMAQAHERDGAKDLAGERLAMAVEVSNRAVPESIRYATFLQREGRTQAAVAVLNDSRKVNADDPALLQALAKLYISTSNWTEAEGIAAAFDSLPPSPSTAGVADEIRAAVLMGRGQVDKGIGLLSEMATNSGEAGNARAERRAAIALLQTQVKSGKIAEARSSLDQMLAASPDDVSLKLFSAGLYVAERQSAKAEEIYSALIQSDPKNVNAIKYLFILLSMQNRSDEASDVLQSGLKSVPDSPDLLLIQAARLERDGDIDGAIAVYEGLYAKDSANLLLANNLASLITSYRDGADDLDRASAVARRLRGTTVPAFADTYGWIAYRRGDVAEALPYLETAASGLDKDPVVQIHLGMAYAALNRLDEAKAALQKGIDLAGPEAQSKPVVEARAKLAELNG